MEKLFWVILIRCFLTRTKIFWYLNIGPQISVFEKLDSGLKVAGPLSLYDNMFAVFISTKDKGNEEEEKKGEIEWTSESKGFTSA